MNSKYERMSNLSPSTRMNNSEDKMTVETFTTTKETTGKVHENRSNGNSPSSNGAANQSTTIHVGERHFLCSCVEMTTFDAFTMFIAEIIGTGMLLFIGCMGSLNFGIDSHPFFGATLFGLTVMIIIGSFGCVSGAHLNPAVTLAAYVYNAITLKLAILYVIAQLIGGILGFGLLKLLTPITIFYGENGMDGGGPGACSTVPHKDLTTVQAFFFEYLATTVLIILCCGVWDPRNRQHQDSVPLKFGFAVAALSYSVGPFTGCSMNPARTLGPAVWNGDFELHWMYWIAPLLAGLNTALIYKYMFRREVTEPPNK